MNEYLIGGVAVCAAAAFAYGYHKGRQLGRLTDLIAKQNENEYSDIFKDYPYNSNAFSSQVLHSEGPTKFSIIQVGKYASEIREYEATIVLCGSTLILQLPMSEHEYVRKWMEKIISLDPTLSTFGHIPECVLLAKSVVLVGEDGKAFTKSSLEIQGIFPTQISDVAPDAENFEVTFRLSSYELINHIDPTLLFRHPI